MGFIYCDIDKEEVNGKSGINKLPAHGNIVHNPEIADPES